jgi:hypothetical protein
MRCCLEGRELMTMEAKASGTAARKLKIDLSDAD